MNEKNFNYNQERLHKAILYLCGKLGKSQAEVGEMLGYSNKSSFSTVINGIRNFPFRKLQTIVELSGGDVSLDYLLGKEEKIMTNNLQNNTINGGMMNVGQKGGTINQYNGGQQSANDSEEYKPVIPQTIIKNIDCDVVAYVNKNKRYLDKSPLVHQFSEYNYVITMNSESMVPFIKPSDILALKLLGEDDEVINGEMYAIDIHEGFICRMVTDIGDCLLCKSFNPERYADMKIPKNRIKNIFRIVGLVRNNI